MDERVPIFLLDSHEKFQPIAVESVEAVPGARMILPGGGDGGEIRLDALPPDGGRMNFPPHPEDQEKLLHPKFGGVGYRREVEDGGLTWIQYWLWYLYNPKRYGAIIGLRAGVHEGDWEFVQVGYREGKPYCMTVSQHHSGGKRNWKEVEKRDGRPVVYVARDSHANFFTAVDQDEEIKGDDANGKGAVLDDLDWREFGPWARWYGLWGNSTEEGKSPESPGQQGDRFYLPRSYHEAAVRQ